MCASIMLSAMSPKESSASAVVSANITAAIFTINVRNAMHAGTQNNLYHSTWLIPISRSYSKKKQQRKHEDKNSENDFEYSGKEAML
jgi:hypothetical protein